MDDGNVITVVATTEPAVTVTVTYLACNPAAVATEACTEEVNAVSVEALEERVLKSRGKV